MKIIKKHDGLVLRDQFTSTTGWVTTSATNISLGTGLVITHNLSKDVRVMRDIPNGAQAIELAIDYTPAENDDLAGVILYTSDTEYLEALETVDNTQVNVTDFKIIYENGQYNIFAFRGGGYEFVTSSKIPFTKFGFVTKQGTTTLQPLKAIEVLVSRNQYLTFSAMPDGAYGEFTVNGEAVIEQAVNGVIKYEMAHLEQTIAVRLLAADNQEFYVNEQLYEAGSEYYAASELILLKNGVELKLDQDNEIGSIVGNAIEVQLEIKNPLAYVINNINVQIIEYASQYGYTLADIAVDVNGVPGDFGDTLIIQKLEPQQSVLFWFKFDKTTDTTGANSLYTKIAIAHDKG